MSKVYFGARNLVLNTEVFVLCPQFRESFVGGSFAIALCRGTCIASGITLESCSWECAVECLLLLFVIRIRVYLNDILLFGRV